MLDAGQFSAWLVVAIFFVGCRIPPAVTIRTASQAMADRWEHLRRWMLAHGERELDDDEEFARRELREVLREERLLANLERVRHLVATDTYMSATRQIGNRIAYEQLLVEAHAFAVRPPLVPTYRSWEIESADLSTTRRASGPETLDIHWR